jgi:TM2 domain-containing membrane protein YozV
MSQPETYERRTKFCVNCGAKIDVRAEICPKCGVRVAPPPIPPRKEYVEKKSPGIAAVLSFLFVGLGQIYNGQISKGFLFIILGVISVLLIIFLIGIPLYLVLWGYSIYDAYHSAEKINVSTLPTH